MADATAYLKEKLLDHMNAVTSWTMPPAVYLAAFVGDPQTTSGEEVDATTSTLYARQEISFAAAGADGIAENDADIKFPVAGASWGTIDYIGIYDAETSGNLLWSDALAAPKAIGAGDQLIIPEGDLTVTLT